MSTSACSRPGLGNVGWEIRDRSPSHERPCNVLVMCWSGGEMADALLLPTWGFRSVCSSASPNRLSGLREHRYLKTSCRTISPRPTRRNVFGGCSHSRFFYGVPVEAIISVVGNHSRNSFIVLNPKGAYARPSRDSFGAPCVCQQRLQEELRELQIRLDGANMLAGQLEREISDCQQR